jgi:hypothetical protein
MNSGRNLPSGDVLQVIPRHSPSIGYADSTGSVSVSVRVLPARRRKLTRVVFAALGACTLILVAAAIAHVARSSNSETAAMAATNEPAAAAAPVAPPPAAAAPPAAPAVTASTLDAPTTGTLRLQRPAVPGKVWVDGQKIVASSATVACGTHQVKVGAHGKAHAIDIPCGGELKLTK